MEKNPKMEYKQKPMDRTLFQMNNITTLKGGNKMN